METYGDIIKRIVEIIAISENKKLENNPEDHFVKLLFHNILEDYADEFNDLLKSEKACYLISTNNNSGSKNNELITECLSLSEQNTALKDKYIEIVDILKTSLNKNALELEPYLGYFIDKDSFKRFLALCKEVKVGPGKVTNLNIDTIQSLRENKDQKARIDKYLEENISKVEVSDPLANCRFKHLIYLGINGALTLDMIREERNYLSSQEYNLLVQELLDFQIFTKEELLSIEQKPKFERITDVDELVEFFGNKEILNPQALKLLIPAIGLFNYNYLLDELYKRDRISTIDYEQLTTRKNKVR